MEKGKFGVRPALYAALAFVFVLVGQPMGLFLLAGVTIFVEKDEWASRQVIQAILLIFLTNFVSICFNLLGFMDWFSWASYGSGIYKISSIWAHFESVVLWIMRILTYVFALIGLLKVAKGKEAGVPLASKFADWAYGKITVVQQPVAPAVPMQQPAAPVQQPVAPQAPVEQPAAPAADVCKNCGAPLNGANFCTKCGTPAAK